MSRFSNLLLLLAVSSLVTSARAQISDADAETQMRSVMSKVSESRISQDFHEIGEIGSRIAGSRGEARTFDYIEGRLKGLGAVSVRRIPFDIATPDPDATGTLSILGRDLDVFPLWPNLVKTSTCDLTGRLVYVGNGSLESMRGLDIQGSIAVMEMSVGANWKNAAKLGAKAVIYVEPDRLSRGTAESKFSAIPLDFPRFFLPVRAAGPVLRDAETGQSGHLKCRQDWKNGNSNLLLAEFPGSDPAYRNEPIEIMAYADSMSVVPKLAPGGEAISSLAAFLEAAEIFSKQPHRRPIRFVLAGAHGLALQGARERASLAIEGKLPEPLFTLTLDLSSGSRSIGSYSRAYFYDFRNETIDEVRQLSRNLRQHAELVAKIDKVTPTRTVLTDATNDGDSRTWKNNVPGKFSVDSEPLVAAGLRALTFFTIEDSRDRVDTPFDTPDQVDLANVYRQTRTTVAMLQRILNDPAERSIATAYSVPLRPAEPTRMSLVGGFAQLVGRVVEYDAQKSFVPDTAVPNTLVVALPKQKTTMGVRNEIIDFAGSDARYQLDGLMPVSAYWQGNGVTMTRVQAFRLDAPTGKVDYAASWGFYGDGSYPIVFPLKTGRRESPIVVFKCRQVNVYDLVDPQDLKALPYLYVIDAETNTRPQDWGEYDPVFDQKLNSEMEDGQTIFLREGQKFRLLSGTSLADIRLVLTNSTPEDERGIGYVAPGGKADGRAAEPTDGVFNRLALNVAKDFAQINGARLAKFAKYRIVSPSVKQLHEQSLEAIKRSEAELAKKNWPEADRQARAAWGYALRAHPVIQSTTNDVVNGVVFYLFLLIPFSYFLERLLVGNQLLSKQLTVSVGIFLGSFVLLRLIHPAFEIVSNPLMIFIAFIMGTLSLVVISFILGKFEQSLKAVQRAQSGVHEVDIKRSSVAMAAFNLGVGNMRRRKARTVLTTLTLVVMTFIVLSFTSIVSELSLNELASDNPGAYPGMLLRNPGLEPMELATYRQVSNEFAEKGTVVRRTAYYGADIGETGVLTLQRADRIAEVRALAGFDPGESMVLQPQKALSAGRWFLPGETDAMILPSPLATQLKIGPREVETARVTFAGKEYRVVGIADAGMLRNTVDLDGDSMMPADFSLSKKFQEATSSTTQAFRKFERLDPATVFILPAETTLNLGADIRTMAVAFPEAKQTRESLTELMPRLRMNLYAAVPDTTGKLVVKQFSVFQSSKGTGIVLILVQLAIASVFVLNTMVASVYERTKEIAIFSSIGLAPNHIGMLFFAESLVYGIMGSVIGYFVAQGTAKVIVATNTLQGLTLNFSSTSAVMSAVIVMAVVLLSTIYPAKKAAQIAAPARNDDVFATEPEGDEWQLPLPFSIGDSEARPLVKFLSEWLKAYEEYTIGDFVTQNTSFTIDGEHYVVETTAWLAPYDLGISQTFRLEARPSGVHGIYALDLTLTRLAGDPENWPVVNQRFLASLRRQFLTWRTLDAETRAKYSVEVPDLQPA